MKHGHASPSKGRSRAYIIWVGMKQRCKNPKDPYFHCYGEKGISVCERWEAFENFLADMGDPPQGLTLDRINPKEGYSKDNCRWSSAKEQARNRSNTIFFRCGEFKAPAIDIASRIGVKYGTVLNRIYSLKWPIPEAVLGKGVSLG